MEHFAQWSPIRRELLAKILLERTGSPLPSAADVQFWDDAAEKLNPPRLGVRTYFHIPAGMTPISAQALCEAVHKELAHVGASVEAIETLLLSERPRARHTLAPASSSSPTTVSFAAAEEAQQAAAAGAVSPSMHKKKKRPHNTSEEEQAAQEKAAGYDGPSRATPSKRQQSMKGQMMTMEAEDEEAVKAVPPLRTGPYPVSTA